MFFCVFVYFMDFYLVGLSGSESSFLCSRFGDEGKGGTGAEEDGNNAKSKMCMVL